MILADKTIVYDLIEQMLDPDVAIRAYTTELDLSFLHEPYPQPVRRTLLVSGDRDLVAGEIPELMRKYRRSGWRLGIGGNRVHFQSK